MFPARPSKERETEAPLLTISEISLYYHFNCDKLLKNLSLKYHKRERSDKRKSYTHASDESALREVLTRRGSEFEKKIVERLSNVIDCRGSDSSKSRDILRNSQIGQVFYQLKLEVPEDLYEDLGIKGVVRLKPFIPDFIKVVEEDGERKLMIVDAKVSKAVRFSHQFQVASYVYLLNYLIEKIRGLSMSRTGG
ncbi:10784_t:CDS:2, partial [Acaulospora colombiana]